jgi:hypothetical protein
MQGLMNITKNQVPKLLLHAARATTATTAPLLTSVASRNYAGSVQKQNKVGEGASHAFEPVKANADKLNDAWRPAENPNPLKELESGDLNLSDSGVLGISVDMDALKETKEATEHWKEETKEYSEESAKQAANLGTGFAHTASGFTTTSLKDSAAEMIAPYAAATSSIGTLAAEKIGGKFQISLPLRTSLISICNVIDFSSIVVLHILNTVVMHNLAFLSKNKLLIFCC